MADLSIQTRLAQEWVQRVRGEIDRTNITLGEVSKVCTSVPGSDDTIIQLICETGNLIENTWDTTKNVFKNAWEDVENGIEAVVRAGEKITEGLSKLKDTIK
ncbi:MAG: hypothetical protein E7455_07025 [Ruminococcaceae bacterium]|nr:hypothetical protein [Oscillospiraceae bacterium]